MAAGDSPVAMALIRRPVENAQGTETQHALETAYRELAVQIRDLMQLLRGEEAA